MEVVMALFADNMRTLTGAKEASDQRRLSALAAVSARTEQVLSEARFFPQQVRSAQQQEARMLRNALAVGRRALSCGVKQLRHGVGQLQREVRQAHQQVGRDLVAALSRDRFLRREAVQLLLTSYRSARQELNQDLSEAAQCWREATAR
jgi:hypothetical protein